MGCQFVDDEGVCVFRSFGLPVFGLLLSVSPWSRMLTRTLACVFIGDVVFYRDRRGRFGVGRTELESVKVE